MILKSPRLSKIRGIRHGFATRLGGVSSGHAATLDFSDRESGHENRKRVLQMIGCAADSVLAEVTQVHHNQVVAPGIPEQEADGLVTDRPGTALGIRTADCAPIIAVAAQDGQAQAVAALHAGWRGATLGIVEQGVQALEALGGRRAHIHVAIGPSIGPSRFEVGQEVVEAATRILKDQAAPISKGPNGRAFFDLRAFVAMLFLNEGVPRTSIDLVGGCTYENAAMFFSHRRTKGLTGRHLSLVEMSEPIS